MVPYESVLDADVPRVTGNVRVIWRWGALPLALAAGCTPIGDNWSPGMVVALVVAGGAILFLGWRYFAGGDDRRARRQERRDDRRE
jgi:hypothetical protein